MGMSEPERTIYVSHHDFEFLIKEYDLGKFDYHSMDAVKVFGSYVIDVSTTPKIQEPE